MTPSFDLLIEEVENLDELLCDGPEQNSEEFLKAVQRRARDIHEIAGQLTVGNVDAEFVMHSTDILGGQ